MKDACKVMLEPLTESGQVKVAFGASLLEEAIMAGRGGPSGSLPCCDDRSYTSVRSCNAAIRLARPHMLNEKHHTFRREKAFSMRTLCHKDSSV